MDHQRVGPSRSAQLPAGSTGPRKRQGEDLPVATRSKPYSARKSAQDWGATRSEHGASPQPQLKGTKSRFSSTKLINPARFNLESLGSSRPTTASSLSSTSSAPWHQLPSPTPSIDSRRSSLQPSPSLGLSSLSMRDRTQSQTPLPPTVGDVAMADETWTDDDNEDEIEIHNSLVKHVDVQRALPKPPKPPRPPLAGTSSLPAILRTDAKGPASSTASSARASLPATRPPPTTPSAHRQTKLPFTSAEKGKKKTSMVDLYNASDEKMDPRQAHRLVELPKVDYDFTSYCSANHSLLIRFTISTLFLPLALSDIAKEESQFHISVDLRATLIVDSAPLPPSTTPQSPSSSSSSSSSFSVHSTAIVSNFLISLTETDSASNEVRLVPAMPIERTLECPLSSSSCASSFSPKAHHLDLVFTIGCVGLRDTTTPPPIALRILSDGKLCSSAKARLEPFGAYDPGVEVAYRVEENVWDPEDAIARRLEVLGLGRTEREAKMLPEAKSVWTGEPKGGGGEEVVRVPRLDKDRLFYSYKTRLPLEPGSVFEDEEVMRPELMRHHELYWDQHLDCLDLRAEERWVKKAHLRWTLVNPHPPDIFRRELEFLYHYAPFFHEHRLRTEVKEHLFSLLEKKMLTSVEWRHLAMTLDQALSDVEKGLPVRPTRLAQDEEEEEEGREGSATGEEVTREESRQRKSRI